jgi:hypothetical protein
MAVGDYLVNGILVRADGAVYTTTTANMALLAAPSGSSLVGHIASGAGAVARTAQAEIRDLYLNVKGFGALGDNSTDDTAAFQAAINACPVYGIIFIPDGDYVISGTMNIVRPLQMIGVGFGSQLIVSTSMSLTDDVINVTPAASTGSYFAFRDFAITPRSTIKGRHAFYLDATSAAIKDSLFQNVQCYALNDTSFFATGTGAGEGSIVVSTIADCTFTGGVEIETCGDRVVVERNHISGTNKSLEVSFQAGASTFVFSKNVVTGDGGVKIGDNGTAVQIVHNEFETNGTFTGSNGALIDIAGSSGNACNDTVVAFNSFQVVNSITTDTIRCDFANRTQIFGNRMDRGITTSNDVAITANAADTMIGLNSWPDTTPVISDSGTRTTWFTPVSGNWYSRQLINIASSAGAVDGERIRLGRSDDGNRYSSLYYIGASGGTAHASFRIHDGVSATSQADAVYFKANSAGGFVEVPMGLSTLNGKVACVANRNTTAVGNVGGGEDDLMTYSLPLNSMNAATKGVRITAWGTTANNSNPKTVILYFGTAAILTTALTVSQAGVWRINAEVLSTGTDIQQYVTQLVQGGTTTLVDAEQGTAAQDDGAAITIKCTGTVTDGGGGINNDDIVQEGIIVEFMS